MQRTTAAITKQPGRGHRYYAALGLLLALCGCAKLDAPVMTRATQGAERTVEMQAGRYDFDPNNIEALEGDRIVIMITNIEDKDHNLTIVDPSGRQIESVDLPPRTTLPVRIALLEAGTYKFSCNKPFHALLGMKGRITAAPR